MRLIALKLNKRGDNGWESEKISFGQHITQVSGENGSGKTPIIQALVFCLGYPVTFRDDVRANCKGITLWLEVGGKEYQFDREIADGLSLTVTSGTGTQAYSDERQFSVFFFSLLGLDTVNLLDTSARKASPYIATVLPLFFLDQDNGYSDFYKPYNTFIKDQLQEMVRFIFRFSQKNIFEFAKDSIELKRQRETLDELIAGDKSVLNRLNATRPSNANEDALLRQISDRKNQLDQLRQSKGSSSDAASAFDSAIYEITKAITNFERESADLSLRVSSFSRIKQDIEIEINTLSLNERAKRLFESLESICSKENCGLFQKSTENYGKNLLYLKDQSKDLESSANAAEQRNALLQQEKKVLQNQLQDLTVKREKLLKDEGFSGLVDAISNITESIATLEQELTTVRQINSVSMRIDKNMQSRAKLSDQIDSIESHGRKADPNMVGLRSELRQLTAKWLDVLGTENVDRNLFIDNDFKFQFGVETIKAFKGSTKVRVVLALHAALFEAYLSRPGARLSCLIFDTPNQQEIKVDDLRNFMLKLKEVCVEYGAQVIFASKDYRHEANSDSDAFIEPKFPGLKHPMYLGTVLPP